jgi:hypothetical protein
MLNHTHLHDEREQRVSTTYNQVTRKVARVMRLLRLGGQYDISNESHYGARHDVITTVPGLVTVPRLSPNHGPAYQVGPNRKSLRIDGTVPEAFDYL